MFATGTAMFRKRIQAALFACLFLCSPVFAEEHYLIAQPAPELPTTKIQIAFLGNSLTLHGPNKSIGWDGNWGMAASSMDKDYTHITLALLGLNETEAYIRNLYPFENIVNSHKSTLSSLSDLFEIKPKIIVVQLGDNTPTDGETEFLEGYKGLINISKAHSEELICLSTWWNRVSLNQKMEEICNVAGGDFIWINDIFLIQEKYNLKKIHYDNAGVNIHPHDWAMQAIAIKITNMVGDSQKKIDSRNSNL